MDPTPQLDNGQTRINNYHHPSATYYATTETTADWSPRFGVPRVAQVREPDV